MDRAKQWWSNDLSIGVKIVFLVLLANAVPAFTILMGLSSRTETLFVWTIKPEINARLVGVMYSNALLLVIFGAFQPNWPRVRVIMVVITLFSLIATALTFFYLDPFLKHPWYHLAFWLTMYFALVFVAPYVFITHERRYGGKLPVQIPLTAAARAVFGVSLVVSAVLGFSLLFRIDDVNEVMPWKLPPLVGGLIGVLFTTHFAAYAWALWDGDWLRTRPMFWQAPITSLMFIMLPVLHSGDLRADTGVEQAAYLIGFGVFALAHLGVILSYRSAEKKLANG